MGGADNDEDAAGSEFKRGSFRLVDKPQYTTHRNVGATFTEWSRYIFYALGRSCMPISQLLIVRLLLLSRYTLVHVLGHMCGCRL